jgi:hypothetical protein
MIFKYFSFKGNFNITDEQTYGAYFYIPLFVRKGGGQQDSVKCIVWCSVDAYIFKKIFHWGIE